MTITVLKEKILELLIAIVIAIISITVIITTNYSKEQLNQVILINFIMRIATTLED